MIGQDALTVTEHLVLFARIKGVRESLIPGLVSAKVEEMGLSDFADKAAASLSGGNQRKLSVAIATMGEPPVLFLDEPSTVRPIFTLFLCGHKRRGEMKRLTWRCVLFWL